MCVVHLVVSDSLQPHGLQQARFLCLWSFPGKKMGCHSFFMGSCQPRDQILSPALQTADSLLSEPPEKPYITSSVQLLSHVRLFATPWTAAHQVPLSFTVSQNLFRFMSIESVMPSNHLILCFPLLLLPSIFPIIRVFSNESALHIRWPNYWSFSISPYIEYLGLISFRINQFDLLAFQGTLKSLL